MRLDRSGGAKDFAPRGLVSCGGVRWEPPRPPVAWPDAGGGGGGGVGGNVCELKMPFLPVKFDPQKRVKLAQGLWILYWLSAVAGALLLGLGVFFKVELRKRSELMDQSESHLLPNLLMLAGLLACGLNAFGGKVCQDSLDPLKYSKWKGGLRRFLLLCGAFNALLLLLALLCFLLQFAVYLALSRGLRSSIRFYKDTDTPGRCFMKRTLDLTQIEFRCCGNVNFRDWFEVQWISNRYLDMSDGQVKE